MALPRLIARSQIDFVVCNAENAAGGSGLTVDTFEELHDAGVDICTLGDHAYRKDEVHSLFDRDAPVCRPANYPPDAPGPDHCIGAARDGTPIGVFSVLGRVFMNPVDCPLRTSDSLIERLASSARIVIVDAHAEATSEKQLLARYLDGRVAAVLGTHTHVPTADEQILPGGTAYQTDVGMTGPYDSIIGRRVDRVLNATLTAVPQHLDVASGDPRLCATLVTVDLDSGKSTAIERIVIDRQTAESLSVALR